MAYWKETKASYEAKIDGLIDEVRASNNLVQDRDRIITAVTKRSDILELQVSQLIYIMYRST